MCFHDIKTIGRGIYLLTNVTLKYYTFPSVYLSTLLNYKLINDKGRFLLIFVFQKQTTP